MVVLCVLVNIQEYFCMCMKCNPVLLKKKMIADSLLCKGEYHNVESPQTRNLEISILVLCLLGGRLV
jgi:hypothetical protein